MTNDQKNIERKPSIAMFAFVLIVSGCAVFLFFFGFWFFGGRAGRTAVCVKVNVLK